MLAQMTAISTLFLLATATIGVRPVVYVDPSCASIYALPQHMHPGVPQAAAEAKCQHDCAQPGFTWNWYVPK